MTFADEITKAVSPIIAEHMREARERIGHLERDINEARAHLQTAKEVCERLTKQAPQTQQDGPWCVVAVDRMTAKGADLGKLYPVVYEGPSADHWGEDSAHVMLSRRVADELRERLHREAPAELALMRVVTVAEWVAIYTRANGPVKS